MKRIVLAVIAVGGLMACATLFWPHEALPELGNEASSLELRAEGLGSSHSMACETSPLMAGSSHHLVRRMTNLKLVRQQHRLTEFGIVSTDDWISCFQIIHSHRGSYLPHVGEDPPDNTNCSL